MMCHRVRFEIEDDVVGDFWVVASPRIDAHRFVQNAPKTERTVDIPA
jgi:hypothetical protein